MGYYIRVLGKKPASIPLSLLQQTAAPASLKGEEDADGWSELVLSHESGPAIAMITRDPVIEGELGSEELREFIEEVHGLSPASAASWLEAYLPEVRVIYAFQILSGTEVDDGWSLLHKVYGDVWNHAGGILQADSEGFSNEDGNTILWQFNPDVSGSWNCAVLGNDGLWISFAMDLGSQEQREAFWRGEVPPGAQLRQVQ